MFAARGPLGSLSHLSPSPRSGELGRGSGRRRCLEGCVQTISRITNVHPDLLSFPTNNTKTIRTHHVPRTSKPRRRAKNRTPSAFHQRLTIGTSSGPQNDPNSSRPSPEALTCFDASDSSGLLLVTHSLTETQVGNAMPLATATPLTLFRKI